MNAGRIGGNGAMLLVGMLIAFGCGMSQVQQPPDVSESEEGAVRSVLDKYTAACEAKDLAAVSSVFSHDSDVVLINVADPDRIVGWEKVAEGYKELFSVTGEVKMRHTDVAVKMLESGAAACLTCNQSIRGTSQGRAFAIEGVRVTWVLEKQEADWRIVHAHWSLTGSQ